MVHGVHLDAGTATLSDVSVARHATGSLSVGVPGAPYRSDPIGPSPDPPSPLAQAGGSCSVGMRSGSRLNIGNFGLARAR